MSFETLSAGVIERVRRLGPSGGDRGVWGDPSVRNAIGGLQQLGVVIHALILREARTRYGRRSASYAWALIVPMAQLTLLMAIFSFVGQVAPVGGSLPVFFLSGILPAWLWRNVVVRGATAINSNRALMGYPQVGAFEVVTARAILEMLTSLATFVIFALILLALYDTPLTRWVDHPLSLLSALGTLGFFCYGTSVLSAQIGRIFEPWGDISDMSGRIMFYTCGVWFTLSSVPPVARDVILYNPMAHIIEWIRDAAFKDYASNLYDPTYAIGFSLVCLVVGLFIDWLYRISGYDLNEST